MEDKNNNLEDFLRKKFSGIEDEGGDWARPSQRTREQVLAQIVPASTPFWNRKRVALLSVLLLAFLMGSYIIYLNQNISELRTTVNQQEQQLEQLLLKEQQSNTYAFNPSKNKAGTNQNSTAQLAENSKNTTETIAHKNNQTRPPAIQNNTENNTNKTTENTNSNPIKAKDIAALEAEVATSKKEIANLKKALGKHQRVGAITTTAIALKAENQALKTEQKALKKELNRSKEEVTRLQSDRALLIERLNEATINNAIAEGNVVDSELEQGVDIETNTNQFLPALAGLPLTDAALEKAEAINLVEPNPAFALKKKRSKVQFDVGYEFALQGLFTEIQRNIQGQRPVAGGNNSTVLLLHNHALKIGCSPFKNFWVRTGFQVGFASMDKDYRMGIAYDDDDEYIRQDGNRGNDFTIQTGSIYAQSINEVRATIPNNISEGDLFEFNVDNEIKFQRYQIPLELEYHLGKDKLRWIVQLGSKYNFLLYKQQEGEINASASNQSISFDQHNASLVDEPLEPLIMDYFSIHGGVGAQYQLTDHWGLRALFNVEYNFIENDNFTSASRAGLSFKLGLNYKF